MRIDAVQFNPALHLYIYTSNIFDIYLSLYLYLCISGCLVIDDEVLTTVTTTEGTLFTIKI